MRFTVDRAIDADLRGVYELGLSLCGTSPAVHEWTAENLAEILAGDDGICLTAKERKRILGFITGIHRPGGEARILFLAAVEHPLRQKVLEVLLESFKNWACGRGAEKINFTVDRNNTNLLNFLSTLNFSEERSLVELTCNQAPPAD